MFCLSRIKCSMEWMNAFAIAIAIALILLLPSIFVRLRYLDPVVIVEFFLSSYTNGFSFIAHIMSFNWKTICVLCALFQSFDIQLCVCYCLYHLLNTMLLFVVYSISLCWMCQEKPPQFLPSFFSFRFDTV